MAGGFCWGVIPSIELLKQWCEAGAVSCWKIVISNTSSLSRAIVSPISLIDMSYFAAGRLFPAVMMSCVAQCAETSPNIENNWFR